MTYKDAGISTRSTASSLGPPKYGQTAEEINGQDAKGPLDLVDSIIAFENGELDEDATIEFFQHLINTGLAWTLQGCYGRAAADLIRMGRCHR